MSVCDSVWLTAEGFHATPDDCLCGAMLHCGSVSDYVGGYVRVVVCLWLKRRWSNCGCIVYLVTDAPVEQSSTKYLKHDFARGFTAAYCAGDSVQQGLLQSCADIIARAAGKPLPVTSDLLARACARVVAG